MPIHGLPCPPWKYMSAERPFPCPVTKAHNLFQKYSEMNEKRLKKNTESINSPKFIFPVYSSDTDWTLFSVRTCSDTFLFLFFSIRLQGTFFCLIFKVRLTFIKLIELLLIFGSSKIVTYLLSIFC